ncbi:hypothetical protein HUJ04_005331 [Dendroctonus ponderosae]|nr:hypothetical protein HUJ04_005331 [Dendroctonus ponderosae]
MFSAYILIGSESKINENGKQQTCHSSGLRETNPYREEDPLDGKEKMELQPTGDGLNMYFYQRLFNSVGCRPIRLVISNMMEGISTNAECSKIPEVLQAGCCFRFGWYENADNPQVNFEQLECREELTI